MSEFSSYIFSEFENYVPGSTSGTRAERRANITSGGFESCPAHDARIGLKGCGVIIRLP